MHNGLDRSAIEVTSRKCMQQSPLQSKKALVNDVDIPPANSPPSPRQKKEERVSWWADLTGKGMVEEKQL